ncbi:MAG: hypothetical protein M1334_04270, partial [Patescibacteria group bacterium]|nr:hypothetical protein [Patescibacteria group bacterium]
MKKYSSLIFIVIILVAIAGGFFIYPKFIGASFQPWRLGLDLVGGAHLVYEVDLSKVSPQDYDSIMNGLRDVIERRVNSFGVSEPQVYTAQSGNSHQLIVELAGIIKRELIKRTPTKLMPIDIVSAKIKSKINS